MVKGKGVVVRRALLVIGLVAGAAQVASTQSVINEVVNAPSLRGNQIGEPQRRTRSSICRRATKPARRNGTQSSIFSIVTTRPIEAGWEKRATKE